MHIFWRLAAPSSCPCLRLSLMTTFLDLKHWLRVDPLKGHIGVAAQDHLTPTALLSPFSTAKPHQNHFFMLFPNLHRFVAQSPKKRKTEPSPPPSTLVFDKCNRLSREWLCVRQEVKCPDEFSTTQATQALLAQPMHLRAQLSRFCRCNDLKADCPKSRAARIQDAEGRLLQ